MRKSMAAVAAVMLATANAAQAQDAGVLRLFQGGREVGREVYRWTGDVLETTVTIPLISMRLVSRMEWTAAGRLVRTEERVYNLRNDSLRRSYTAAVDGDSVRLTLQNVFAGGSAPADTAPRRWAKAGAPDAIPADQNLSPYMHLLERAARQDRTWRLWLPNADSVFEMRAAWHGDTAQVDIGPQRILMVLGLDGRIATASIPVGGVRYARYAGTPDALPPMEGLNRPAPDYRAPAGADYTAEEVRVPVHPAAGDTFSLGCTFTKPVRGGPRFPASITLTGSGLEDRDENLWPLAPDYHLYRQVAARLAQAGIAVLRCDDRGFGASHGPVDSATIADFAVDAEAQLAYLRTRPDVNTAKLAIIGHSEGGSVGPMTAADDRGVAAVVVMAGMGKPMQAVLRDQFLYATARAQGLTPEQLATARADAIRQADGFGGDIPYMRYMRTFDPLVVARRVRAPVLIVQGMLDRQVSEGQADTLGAAIRAGGNRDVTVRKFAGLNHLFVVSPSGTGAPDEYASLTDVAVPATVLDTIAEWLSARLVGSARSDR